MCDSSIEYDGLGRAKEINTNIISRSFNYLSKGDHASNYINSIWYGINGIKKDNLKYTYDIKGNIIKICENGEEIASYNYDNLNRLVRENNKILNKTITFSYDAGGNIIYKTEYAYTLAETLIDGTKNIFEYPTTGWKDQLVAYNGKKFEYDAMGNPKTYKEEVLEWSHGRQLDKYGNFVYKYNANGIRTSKNIDGVETKFYISGNKIMAQDNGNMICFHYGADGLAGFNYQGIGEYLYKKNIQGDIIAIYDNNGTEIVKYVYDAWGNHKTYVLNDNDFVDISVNNNYTSNGENNKTIAELNPFRYRSYYYDLETGLYYLNSRYYDPRNRKIC